MRLFLWHFFHNLENQLSYERWIDKYKLLLQILEAGQIPYEEDFASLRQLLKFMYLQDVQHEQRFDELFAEAVATEGDELRFLLLAQIQPEKITNNEKKPKIKPEGDENIPESEDDTTAIKEENKENKSTSDNGKVTKYFDPQLDESTTNTNPAQAVEKYLYSEDYFPVTNREMVKSWQYLRRKETVGVGQKIDVKATVQKIANDGLFTKVIYQKGQSNRVDTLMIFADMRGSMMPFHELTRRLIDTAKNEGGHRLAPVFYYHDYPLGRVFEAENLTKPVALPTALQRGNRNFTTAFIISDAGAARGNLQRARAQQQYKNTQRFLQQLQRHAARIVWINPLPRHRWQGTAAELLNKHKEIEMLPVIEETDFDFQNAIRLL
ncbi:MAG: hypothetical protein AB8G22_01255 [Saprospiraceae bacterium]